MFPRWQVKNGENYFSFFYCYSPLDPFDFVNGLASCYLLISRRQHVFMSEPKCAFTVVHSETDCTFKLELILSLGEQLREKKM